MATAKTRDERIRTEYNRLKRLLKELSKERLQAADGMLKRIAFMAVTLEDLEEDINDNGEIESFTQGESTYDRQRPAVTVYNTTIKNYTTACKQIAELLPQGAPKKSDAADPFLRIMGRQPTKQPGRKNA